MRIPRAADGSAVDSKRRACEKGRPKRSEVVGEANKLQPKQLALSLLEIGPSPSLGSTLDFSRNRIRVNMKMGYDNAMHPLKKKGKISRGVIGHLKNNFRPS